jgi:hypothetical protein
LTGDPRVPKADRNAEISASIIRRFGEIALENLENATEYIDRYIPLYATKVSADYALQKIAEGDTEECHKDAWERREELREQKEAVEDPVELGNCMLEKLEESGGVKKELDRIEDYVSDLKDWSKIVDALLEGGIETQD